MHQQYEGSLYNRTYFLYCSRLIILFSLYLFL